MSALIDEMRREAERQRQLAYAFQLAGERDPACRAHHAAHALDEAVRALALTLNR